MRHSRWIGVLALAVGLLGGALPTAAQTLGPVVYDNGAMQANANQGALSDFSGNFQVGGRFVLPATTSIGGVRWWGSHSGLTPEVSNFTVRIFDATDNIIGAQLHSFSIGSAATRAADGTLNGIHTQYRYEAQLPSLSLGAGTYMVSIVNDTGASPDWFWSAKNVSGGAGRAHGRARDTDPWAGGPGLDVAYQLTGANPDAPAVPEPGAALLFLPALSVMVLVKRRRSG